MKIKKRLLLLLLLTLIGSFLFIPFIVAGDETIRSGLILRTTVIFTLGSMVVVALTGWAGLVFSDKLDIPMPILRNWELGENISNNKVKGIVGTSVFIGVVVAGATLLGNYFMHPPINKGSILVRVDTSVWAPLVTETISHLFLLSGLFLLIKNNWLSIIISGLFFVVLFHFNSAFSPAMEIYLGALNFGAAVVTGYLFVKKGFEAAVLTHMVMHLILMAVNI
ncbi:hypothetical protein [Mucilaginibacter sp. L3T2-6]|uniref:hypothetical protein n=1 Tax=Mucilaginibacter sp. L3T2-6 TaxID=3062491 RepID=UPI002676B6E8|nr:hypothetical protein [Mucilaginibacter sp. L3T2-6]MDO3645122.1 hypothetical protein [Mucilaginibacter sp. L3T2-6]MDV6217574.1 hypothetical protein [Mucilaginibacter sp. L3T2-6]